MLENRGQPERDQNAGRPRESLENLLVPSIPEPENMPPAGQSPGRRASGSQVTPKPLVGSLDTSVAGWFNEVDLKRILSRNLHQSGEIRDVATFPTELVERPSTERDVFNRKLLIASVVGAATVGMCAFPALSGPTLVSWGKVIGVVGSLYCMSRRPDWGSAPTFSVGGLGDNSPVDSLEAMRAMIALFNSVRGDGKNLSVGTVNLLKEIYGVMQELESQDVASGVSRDKWSNWVERIERANSATTSFPIKAAKLATPFALTWPIWAKWVGL